MTKKLIGLVSCQGKTNEEAAMELWKKTVEFFDNAKATLGADKKAGYTLLTDEERSQLSKLADTLETGIGFN